MKHQFTLVVDAETLARMDRLRTCLGVSRSRVAELALTGQGIERMEVEQQELIKKFNRLADGQGKTWQEYAAWYAEKFARLTYPPNLDALALNTDAWWADETAQR